MAHKGDPNRRDSAGRTRASGRDLEDVRPFFWPWGYVFLMSWVIPKKVIIYPVDNFRFRDWWAFSRRFLGWIQVIWPAKCLLFDICYIIIKSSFCGWFRKLEKSRHLWILNAMFFVSGKVIVILIFASRSQHGLYIMKKECFLMFLL